MDTALKAVKFAFYASATALVALAFFLGCDLWPRAVGIVADLERTVQIVGGAAGEVRTSAKEWAKASKFSQEISQKTLAALQNLADATGNLNLAAASLNSLIKNTDIQVNQKLLPGLADTVGKNDTRLAQLAADSDNTVVAMGKTSVQASEAMQAATAAMKNASALLGDPSYRETAEFVKQTAKSTAGTMENLHAASGDIRTKVHEMTKPASWAEKVGTAILNVGATVANVLRAL